MYSMLSQKIAQVENNVNSWLAQNLQHMEEASVSAVACWYDGNDGTCSA